MPDLDLNTIQVLDKGYVKLVTHMGSDLSIVNAARVSFDRESKELNKNDKRLIDYLIKNNHDSPLRHAYLTIEIYAPLMVARQAWKHVVGIASLEEGSSWNESSRRYVTEEPEFYIPDPWRSAPDNKKQGSGERVDDNLNTFYDDMLDNYIHDGMKLYSRAMEDGIAPEQARLFLPAYGMYVRWRWTASLNALLHFISLRLDEHAQWEIREYAQGFKNIISQYFPYTLQAWEEYRVGQ